MLLLFFLLVVGGALTFLVLGNTHPAVAAFGGALTGFVIWLVCGLFWLLGQGFDGCNSLDADDMCVDTSFGEIRG